MSRRVDALASDQAALKDALAPDPVKALRVALLQRDLRNAQASTTASIDAVRADIDRQYDLMKFVVGTLGLGLLGVIGSIAVPALRDRGPGKPGADIGDNRRSAPARRDS